MAKREEELCEVGKRLKEMKPNDPMWWDVSIGPVALHYKCVDKPLQGYDPTTLNLCAFSPIILIGTLKLVDTVATSVHDYLSNIKTEYTGHTDSNPFLD